MLRFNKRSTRDRVQMPLTPLIDVVFLLLIYFLLTTNFLAEEGIKVKLPQARAVAPQTVTEITIQVDEDGAIYLQDSRMNLPELLDRLRGMLASEGSRLIVVKADRTVMVNRVVEIMDVVKAAGADRLMLATERPF
ncbi:MAG: ExbD/TolR family protein [Desulfobacterales bacterium]